MKKMNHMMFVLGLLLAISVTGDVFAQSYRLAKENPTTARKVRNLGMGNIGVATRGTHDSAVVYNPAGLNDIEKPRFQFFSLTGEVGEKSLGLFNDTKDFVDEVDNATTDAEKIDAFDRFAQERIGEFHHARISMDVFNYVRKNFAAGLVLDQRLDMAFRDQTITEFDARSLGDAMIFLAASTSFMEKLIQVGISVRPTVRFAMDQADETITVADVLEENAAGDSVLIEKVKRIQQRRFGLGVDLGLKSNLAIGNLKDNKVFKFLQPAIGFTWQDMGNVSFDSGPGNEQSISVGLAIHPDIWKLKNTVGMDFRELNQGQAFLSKYHFGVESVIDWVVDFGARLGVSQGYFTAGATVDMHFVKIDAAYYSEEVGNVTSTNGNSRFAATLSFNI